MGRYYVYGNTFPVHDKLKALGCHFDRERRAWYTDSLEVATQAHALVPPRPRCPRGRAELRSGEHVVLTTAGAAAELGIDREQVRALIHRGFLRATRLGRDWLILQRDLRSAERQNNRERSR